MMRAAALAALVAFAPGIDPAVASILSTKLKFSQGELADLRKGKVVRHSLPVDAPGEIAVVGAIRVTAPISRLMDNVARIEDFKRGPDILQIGRFSDPPVLSDLDALTVTQEDFDAVGCQVHDCGVRLPADVLASLPHELETSPNQDQAAAWFKRALFGHVSAYWAGKPGRFLSYDDGSEPIRPADQFAAILSDAAALESFAPGLPAHLKNFPASPMSAARDFIYWSKERFGIAPFITVTQMTLVCPSQQLCLVASKDVYSSRYVDASFALTAASVDAADPSAFYLVYMNRSRANALKGAFAGLRKSIAERRARNGLEDTLKALKARLEAAR